MVMLKLQLESFFPCIVYPKNKETRPVFITDEIMEILKKREVFRILGLVKRMAWKPFL
jgi:hypothetical protein